MPKKRRLLYLVAFLLLALCLGIMNRAGLREFGIGLVRWWCFEARVPWTTSRVVGSPDPPLPYDTRPAFPHLKFFRPLDLAYEPGSDRFFVAEEPGRILSFANDRATRQPDLVVELTTPVRGIALHPRFQENGFLYVTYGRPPDMRLVRYQVSGDPPRCEADSEQLLLTWPLGVHTGGCMTFGPDGCLYVSVGDGSINNDDRRSGQDLSTVLGSILRIDVDHPDAGQRYGVPRDNPFVDRPAARPEIWAYGLRQVWKMTFDHDTGQLWGGDVGQDLVESVHLLQRGANYGWSVMEGSKPFRPDRERGPTPIIPPVVEHGHETMRSVTGGYVYRGQRFPDLKGSYLYGGYDTGVLFGFRWNGKQATRKRLLADTSLRIVAFAQDARKELLILDHIGGQIHELVEATPVPYAPEDFPRTLSATGLFASVKDHVPAPGVLPYAVNAPLWSDGAYKERFLAIPAGGAIDFESISFPETPDTSLELGWHFPHGTVLVKTFSLEMEAGNPASRRRLETRILHLERLNLSTPWGGSQYWRGYTYVWNDEQTEAYLLGPEGLDRTFTVRDPKVAGGERKQTWRFPSRAECTLCHTQGAKFALGVNTAQMNRAHEYEGQSVNQLEYLERKGYFGWWLPRRPADMPALVDPLDESAQLDARARSYLHGNCAHCHRPYGGGNSDMDLQYFQSLAQANIVNAAPAHGGLGLKAPLLVAPGKPERSLLLKRMTTLDQGRMPKIGSLLVDEAGTRLISAWIKQLPSN